ncbi:MAG: NAD(P)-dependent alcohol dehydrogenase [Theionarchaea archaeon]|nr:NAD(P)-dependent alcohol dehydrogenase [Theionarchaea archaeon]
MKAIVCTKYGPPDVLKLKEMEKPQPEDDEVLIRNHGSSINTIDIIARSGKAPRVIFWGARQLTGLFLRFYFGGLRKPKQEIPGYGFAGEIVSVGKDITDWKGGDRVYGYSPGACAEYMTVPVKRMAKKPANVSFQEAAAVPGGASPALLAFRDLARPEKGQKVLIIGASGGVGTFGVQIAKLYGAEVTGVCGPTNLDMVQEIGADSVVDYTKKDYTKTDQTYDIIFDAIGANTLSNCMKILTDDGIYVSNNYMNSPRHLFQVMTNGLRMKKLKSGTANEGSDNLNLLREWIENGKIKPVIDTVYPLGQTADAHRHYETGHSKGRVVITIE